MDIVVCGCGEVGGHAAEVLAQAGHNITVIDQKALRLRKVEDTMDVRTLAGNCADASVLIEAGAPTADLLLAATSSDEVNLLSASIAKGVGVEKSIARVHHRAYFDQRGLDYTRHFGIDQVICPEYSTALEIARALRNPGALAIENFAQGRIEMQEFPVDPNSQAVGMSLIDLPLPTGSRLAAITRQGQAFIPQGTTIIEPDDTVILVGNSQVFQESRKVFQSRKIQTRKKVVIMGGASMAVWLCRNLLERNFSIRLFETNRQRAEELAQKLDWVTVIQSDPTEIPVFEEERLADADFFVSMVDDDEHNILGCALAKSRGVEKVMAVVQRSNYIHLFSHVGIDRAYSPRQVAVEEILNLIDVNPLKWMASLAEGIIDVYRVRVSGASEVVGSPLKDVPLAPNWVVVALQRGEKVRVPGAMDVIEAGDTVLVVGKHGMEKTLRRIFPVN